MHVLNRKFRNAAFLCVCLALLDHNFGNVNNQWCSFHLFACISEMLEMWTGPLGTAEEAHRGARKQNSAGLEMPWRTRGHCQLAPDRKTPLSTCWEIRLFSRPLQPLWEDDLLRRAIARSQKVSGQVAY